MINKFNNLFNKIITENISNNYSLDNWIKIYKSAKNIPNFIENNLPFIQLKQKLIWQNIHRME